jgi:hypothetical protein
MASGSLPRWPVLAQGKRTLDGPSTMYVDDLDHLPLLLKGHLNAIELTVLLHQCRI